jgi:hypothetical protein
VCVLLLSPIRIPLLLDVVVVIVVVIVVVVVAVAVLAGIPIAAVL